ncbi:hypothetical protein [Mucilaginibacter kameinonensis]|nr:hypothetical protein [Mucilaginibacter kameinonensis]
MKVRRSKAVTSEALKMVDDVRIWVADSMNMIFTAARKYPDLFSYK